MRGRHAAARWSGPGRWAQTPGSGSATSTSGCTSRAQPGCTPVCAPQRRHRAAGRRALACEDRLLPVHGRSPAHDPRSPTTASSTSRPTTCAVATATRSGIRFDGAAAARPAPRRRRGHRRADAIIVAPSNPLISIGPILAVPASVRRCWARRVPASRVTHRGRRGAARAGRRHDARARARWSRHRRERRPVRRASSTRWSSTTSTQRVADEIASIGVSRRCVTDTVMRDAARDGTAGPVTLEAAGIRRRRMTIEIIPLGSQPAVTADVDLASPGHRRLPAAPRRRRHGGHAQGGEQERGCAWSTLATVILLLAPSSSPAAHSDPRLVEVILGESRSSAPPARVRCCRGHQRHGLVCANAGIDRSNAPRHDAVVLLPLDPDAPPMSCAPTWRPAPANAWP